jgi:hypothetical protein
MDALVIDDDAVEVKKIAQGSFALKVPDKAPLISSVPGPLLLIEAIDSE